MHSKKPDVARPSQNAENVITLQMFPAGGIKYPQPAPCICPDVFCTCNEEKR